MNRFQAWYRIQPAAIRAILTINVIVYVLWSIVFVHIDAVYLFVRNHLALNPEIPYILFEPWQVITYSFLHIGTGFNGFLHILFNMLWLFWIGKEYEELHGSHRMLGLFLFGALGGALLTILLHSIFPTINVFGGPVYGASGGVLGVMMAVAVLYPYKSISLLLIGTVRLIYVVLGFLFLDILFAAGGGTSISAHMGGALFGLIFARAAKSGVDLSVWARVFFPERRKKRTTSSGRNVQEEGVLSRMESWLSSKGSAREEKPKRATIHPMRKYDSGVESSPRPVANEVDRILDKISEKGYESLTEEEKRTLYEASRK